MTRTIITALAASVAVAATMIPTAFAQRQFVPAVATDTAPVIQIKDRRKGKGRRGLMRQIMQQADANDDRALTQAEVDAYVAKQVSAADANSDGSLTVAEFKTIYADIMERQMVRMFQRMDRDASGTITKEERDSIFAGVVERMDRNGDGKLDRSDRRGGRKDRKKRDG